MDCDQGMASGGEPAVKKTENDSLNSPVCLIVLGMAGSGKTTFVSKLDSYLRQYKRSPYLVNLDPACKNMPYQPNIGMKNYLYFNVLGIYF